MLFQFTIFNHCPQGQIVLEDIIRVMRHQLRALGHEVRCSNERVFIPPEAGWNVVIESFADNPETIPAIAGAHVQGCRFIFLATEEPTAREFNHGINPLIRGRQDAFITASRFCAGILHLVPGEHITRWYGQFAPAAYAEIGYAEGLVKDSDIIEPTYDFGFYGQMTLRREDILGKLSKLTQRPPLLLTDFWTPLDERDIIMRQARVIVQIRAVDEVELVSSTRCASALYFGRPVVAEPHRLSKPWDEIVHFSQSMEYFYWDAVGAARGDWRELHNRQLARLKERLPPEKCILEPLRQIGIL